MATGVLRHLRLLQRVMDLQEIGVAAKYGSGYETGSNIMSCQSPIEVTM